MAPSPSPLPLSAYGLIEEEEEEGWGEEGRWAAQSTVLRQEESREDGAGAAVPTTPIPEAPFPWRRGKRQGRSGQQVGRIISHALFQQSTEFMEKKKKKTSQILSHTKTKKKEKKRKNETFGTDTRRWAGRWAGEREGLGQKAWGGGGMDGWVGGWVVGG